MMIVFIPKHVIKDRSIKDARKNDYLPIALASI
jgi:hypothetical protein